MCSSTSLIIMIINIVWHHVLLQASLRKRQQRQLRGAPADNSFAGMQSSWTGIVSRNYHHPLLRAVWTEFNILAIVPFLIRWQLRVQRPRRCHKRLHRVSLYPWLLRALPSWRHRLPHPLLRSHRCRWWWSHLISWEWAQGWAGGSG